MPNKELLLKTLQYIKDHPNEWNQGFYRCSTGCCCFAGHASLLSGWDWFLPEDYSPFECKVYPLNHKMNKNGLLNWPRDIAQQGLELSYSQAELLFDMNNSLIQIERIVVGIIDGSIE